MTNSREDFFRQAMSRARAAFGLSQQKLADKLISQTGDEGWSQTKIHEIERAQSPRRIKLDEAQAIAGALEMSLEAMLGLGPVSGSSTENLTDQLRNDLALSGSLRSRLDEIHRGIDEQILASEETYLKLAEVGGRIVAASTELYGRGELSGGVFENGEHQEEA